MDTKRGLREVYYLGLVKRILERLCRFSRTRRRCEERVRENAEAAGYGCPRSGEGHRPIMIGPMLLVDEQVPIVVELFGNPSTRDLRCVRSGSLSRELPESSCPSRKAASFLQAHGAFRSGSVAPT